MRDLPKNFWPFFSILILVLAFFWKVFTLNRVPLPADIVTGGYLPWLDYKWGYSVGVPVKNPIVSDSISFIYPMRTLGMDLIKSGQWPLWNPYILNGAPLLANFQSAPFSPTNVFYFLFDNLTAWSWQVIAQHVLGFMFCYLLLRHWKVSKLGSLVGGFAFAFSGFMVVWSQWSVHSLVTAFIPLLIYLADKYYQTGKYRFGLLLSVSLCLQIFSGYPQIVFYTLLGLGIFWLVRIIGANRWLGKSVFFGLFVALGIGLAAIQSIPAGELVDLSQRKVEPIPVHWVFFHWDEMITLLAPDYFGNHATGNYWGPKNYLATVGFIGILPTVLAISGLRQVKRRETSYLAVLIVLSWLLALNTPLSYYLWDKNILGLKAGISYKSLALFTFATSVLAGFGFDVLSKAKKTWPALVLPWLVLGGWGIWTVRKYFLTEGTEDFYRLGIPKYGVALRNLIIPLVLLAAVTGILLFIYRFKRLRMAGNWLLIFLLVFELFRFGWKFTPFVGRNLVYPTTPVIEFLQEKRKTEIFRVMNKGNYLMPVNQNMPYKLEFLGGYDAVYPLTTAEFIGVLNSDNPLSMHQDRFGIVTNEDSRLSDLVNMKYLLIKKGVEYNENKFGKVFEDKSVVVLENRHFLPRAFMVYDWEVEENKTKAFEKLLDKNFPIDKKVILAEYPFESLSANRVVPFPVSMYRYNDTGREADVSYSNLSETRKELRVAVADEGLLFISDTYYPGWRAYIDGKEAKIYRADYAFQAIAIPAGRHVVSLVYRPDSFFRGLRISLASLAFLFLLPAVTPLLGKYRPRDYT